MEFLDAIIENIISKKVECIICGDDEICTMVMSGSRRKAIEFPRTSRLLLLYNSTNLDCYSPAVTAVSVAASQMGGTAVRQLIQRLRGENYEKKTMLDYDILFENRQTNVAGGQNNGISEGNGSIFYTGAGRCRSTGEGL